MREVQPLRELGGDVQRQRLGDDLALGGELLGDDPQVVALDVLEHDEVLAVLRDPEIVNLDDVAVRERRVDARLGQQHLDEALVLREVGEDALDRDELLESLRGDDAALEHLGHAADGDRLEELVLAKLHEAQDAQVNRKRAAGLRGPLRSSLARRLVFGGTAPVPRPGRGNGSRSASSGLAASMSWANSSAALVSTNGPPISSLTASSAPRRRRRRP